MVIVERSLKLVYVLFQQLMDVQNDILVVIHAQVIHHGLKEDVILILVKIYILPSQQIRIILKNIKNSLDLLY
jgi:hypothetical protein